MTSIWPHSEKMPAGGRETQRICMLELTLVFIYSIAQSAKMFAHVVKFRAIKDSHPRDQSGLFM